MTHRSELVKLEARIERASEAYARWARKEVEVDPRDAWMYDFNLKMAKDKLDYLTRWRDALKHERGETDPDYAMISAVLRAAARDAKATTHPRVRVFYAWISPAHYKGWTSHSWNAEGTIHLPIDGAKIKVWPGRGQDLDTMILGTADRHAIDTWHIPPAGVPVDEAAILLYNQFRRAGVEEMEAGAAVIDTLSVNHVGAAV